MTTFPGRWTRIRIVACGVVLVALFLAVGKRAFNLQVGEAEHLRAMAEEQYLREVELPPRRGRILDRNGAELASTADVDSIYCNPRRLPDPADAARKLAHVLNLDRRELEKKLGQRRFFMWVKRKVTPDEAAAAKALNLPGLAFVKEPRRFYPNRTLAATVMGLAGSDGRGLDGVELALDKQLGGTTSSVVGIRDALGRDLAVDGLADAPAGVGADVVLTIDRYLTFVTERAIAEGQARTHAKDVVAIVMNPQTGELLAMASVPTFNPNDPSDAANGARNRAITDAYEPGSTMKTFTIAAALDAGVVRAEERFDCLQGKMMVGKYSIHDTHPHGVLTVAEVFKFSSNIGATKIARRLGRDGFADALGRFGFGHTTGVGLPGERAGVIRPVEKWGDIGFANVSFGQGLTVTPLQMVAGVSAIAAGGVYRAPRVVSRVVQPDGTVETPASPLPERRVMSESAARTMLTIMRGVTEEGGTAKQAAIDGYVVGGKTGTAQKVANGHYDPNKWVSSFVGVVPAEAPRLAIIIVVDEPQGGHLGGAVAAPIFKDIAEQALRYLHVPPTVEVVAAAKNDGTKKSSPERSAAPPRGASAGGAGPSQGPELEDSPTELPVYADADGPGDDPALAEQWNAVAGAEGGRGDSPVPAPAAIPSFAGMTIGEAIRAAHKSGVELAFDDATGTASGVVLAQNPAPGPSTRGALCRVTLRRRE